MDQIYLEKPEHKSEPARPRICATGSCKNEATNPRFKCCDRCRRGAAARQRKHYRSDWMRNERLLAEEGNFCNVCLVLPAPPTHKSCQQCRDKRAAAYARRTPEQIAKAVISRRKAAMSRYWRIMGQRRSKAGQEAYRAFREKENAACRLRSEARARMRKNGTCMSVELEKMGADPSTVARWRRHEERGDAQ